MYWCGVCLFCGQLCTTIYLQKNFWHTEQNDSYIICVKVNIKGTYNLTSEVLHFTTRGWHFSNRQKIIIQTIIQTSIRITRDKMHNIQWLLVDYTDRYLRSEYFKAPEASGKGIFHRGGRVGAISYFGVAQTISLCMHCSVLFGTHPTLKHFLEMFVL